MRYVFFFFGCDMMFINTNSLLSSNVIKILSTHLIYYPMLVVKMKDVATSAEISSRGLDFKVIV